MIDLKSDKAKELSKQECFKLLKEYLDEQVELSRRKMVDEEIYTMPAYSEYIAFQLGLQKAFLKLNNLIPDQGDQNGRK
tara:strand:- start:1765 stop:2001 length:237 start_codon:yes stop_codon:yes gene_type:complete